MGSARKSRCAAIDSRNSDCYKQVSEIQTVNRQVSGYMNELLEEDLECMKGVSTDTIHLGDLSFIIFVLAHHKLFVQGTYLGQIILQLGSEVFCFVLRAGDECLKR